MLKSIDSRQELADWLRRKQKENMGVYVYSSGRGLECFSPFGIDKVLDRLRDDSGFAGLSVLPRGMEEIDSIMELFQNDYNDTDYFVRVDERDGRYYEIAIY